MPDPAPRCARCHGLFHKACAECGACMDAAGYPWERDYGSLNDTRADRAYCSNACRQRAYRRRRTESRGLSAD
jgi:ferredoxin